MRLTEFRDADGNPIQPYYAAFMVEHGLSSILVGSQWPFMSWIQTMWRVFEEHVCRCEPTPGASSMHAREFTAWLQLRVREVSK